MLQLPKRPEHLFFRLCSDHVSIEAIPTNPVRVDFVQLKKAASKNYELLMWTPNLAVLRHRRGQEITVRKNGRMIVRKACSEEDAKDAAVEVLRLAMQTAKH